MTVVCGLWADNIFLMLDGCLESHYRLPRLNRQIYICSRTLLVFTLEQSTCVVHFPPEIVAK